VFLLNSFLLTSGTRLVVTPSLRAVLLSAGLGGGLCRVYDPQPIACRAPPPPEANPSCRAPPWRRHAAPARPELRTLADARALSHPNTSSLALPSPSRVRCSAKPVQAASTPVRARCAAASVPLRLRPVSPTVSYHASAMVSSSTPCPRATAKAERLSAITKLPPPCIKGCAPPAPSLPYRCPCSPAFPPLATCKVFEAMPEPRAASIAPTKS
jgi:hypothetical protein